MVTGCKRDVQASAQAAAFRASRRLVLAALPMVSTAPGSLAQPLRVRYGGDAHFAPFESLDAQGRAMGFQIELLAALGQHLGIAFEIRLAPWPQTEASFREGRLDLVAMVDTEARRAWAHFARGHATPALAVYRREGQPEAQGPQDLQGLRVAVLDGEAMQGTLQTWLAALQGPFLRLPDAAQALAAVQQGRADVALLPRAYAEPLLASGHAPALVGSHLNLALQTYAFAAAPGQGALLARLQQGLDHLEAQGQLESLRTRWLGSHREVADRLRAERGLSQQRLDTWVLGAAALLGLSAMAWGFRRRGQRLQAERAGHQQAQAALQRAEELLERTFARHADAMLLVEPGTGRILDANDALMALTGLPAAALIGRPLADLQRHIDSARLEILVQSLRDQAQLRAAPVQVRRADGQTRHCLVSADHLTLDSGSTVFCLVRDVTEQLAHDAALRAEYEAAAAALAQARQDLQAARAAQTRAESELGQFTRGVAHDLKSPLFAIQGFSGLLRERLQAGRVQEALIISEQISRASHRMGSMVTALGKLAQITRTPLQRLTIDMAGLAQETWALLRASYPQRRAELRLAALPPAGGDPVLVAQVWQNLLDNAAKYSQTSGKPQVAVDSYRDARGQWFRVTDNGVGFDSSRAQGLFQPFQRLHHGDDFEGQGVGLSVVRRIVQHHSGEVRLRSAPGVGTVAEFTLDPAPPGV